MTQHFHFPLCIQKLISGHKHKHQREPAESQSGTLTKGSSLTLNRTAQCVCLHTFYLTTWPLITCLVMNAIPSPEDMTVLPHAVVTWPPCDHHVTLMWPGSPCRAAASWWYSRACWYWLKVFWTAPRFCRTAANLQGLPWASGSALLKHSAASGNSFSWVKFRPMSLYSLPTVQEESQKQMLLTGQTNIHILIFFFSIYPMSSPPLDI